MRRAYERAARLRRGRVRRVLDRRGVGGPSLSRAARRQAARAQARPAGRRADRDGDGGGARLGLRAAFCATVGDDADAGEVVAGLETRASTSAACSASRARRRAWRSSSSTARRARRHRHRAWRSSPAPPLLRDRVAQARIVHLDVTEPAYAMLAAHHRASVGTLVSLDVDHPAPGLDELLPLADVCITSRGVPEQLTGETNIEAALRRARPTRPAGSSAARSTATARRCSTTAT